MDSIAIYGLIATGIGALVMVADMVHNYYIKKLEIKNKDK